MFNLAWRIHGSKVKVDVVFALLLFSLVFTSLAVVKRGTVKKEIDQSGFFSGRFFFLGLMIETRKFG